MGNESWEARVETSWKTTEVDLVSGDKSLWVPGTKPGDENTTVQSSGAHGIERRLRENRPLQTWDKHEQLILATILFHLGQLCEPCHPNWATGFSKCPTFSSELLSYWEKPAKCLKNLQIPVLPWSARAASPWKSSWGNVLSLELPSLLPSGWTVSRVPGPSVCALNLASSVGAVDCFCCPLIYFLVGVYSSEVFPWANQDFSVDSGRIVVMFISHGWGNWSQTLANIGILSASRHEAQCGCN